MKSKSVKMWILGRKSEASRFLVCLIEMVADMSLELLNQKRGALDSPALVSNRVLNDDFIENSSVVECDGERVSDRTFGRIVVVNGKDFIFDAINLGAEGVNSGISRGGVRAAKSSVNYQGR